MKIIIGLGNAGREYMSTRHNIGWRVIDALAKEIGGQYKDKFKLSSVIMKGELGGEAIIIAKPTIMMNNSGQAARALIDFFKVQPEDVIVVHDELDIPFGKVKAKQGGSDGTHNGLASVTEHIGKNYWRVRIGIDQEKRDIPVPADFVLARFNEAEEQKLPELIKTATKKTRELLQ